MSLKTKVVKKVVKYALSTKRGKKLLSEAQKLIHKKKSKTIQQLSVKGVHKDVPLRVSSDKQVKTFKQKPKYPHGGSGKITQRTTHYGPRGAEMKVGTKMARASMWHDTRAKGSESWRNEMIRVFGGIHISQTKEGAKKSVNILAKEYKKRFKKKKIKKATEGGEVVIHANVDRSLL